MARAKAEVKAAKEAQDAEDGHEEAMHEAETAYVEVTKAEAMTERAKGHYEKALAEAAGTVNELEKMKAVYEEVLAESRAAIEDLGNAKTTLEEETAKLILSDICKPPIILKDAVGHQFTLPWHLCKTWKGMEELIKHAFLYVDTIGPQVHEGRYNFVDSNGEIILLLTWETLAQPDMAITMHMWPMPEPPEDTLGPSCTSAAYLARDLPLAKSEGERKEEIWEAPPPPPQIIPVTPTKTCRKGRGLFTISRRIRRVLKGKHFSRTQ